MNYLKFDYFSRIGSVIPYLIDVGVPHLGEETKGRWRVGVVNGELDTSLWDTRREVIYQHMSAICPNMRLWDLTRFNGKPDVE